MVLLAATTNDLSLYDHILVPTIPIKVKAPIQFPILPSTMIPFCNFLFPSSQLQIFIELNFTFRNIYGRKIRICNYTPKP